MTVDGLPAAAQRIQDALTAAGLVREVQVMPDVTRSSVEAAAAIGCDVSQIAKSIIFRARKSGRAVLVVARGNNRVDERAVEALVGEKIGKADADFVRSRTGYVIGGVPPFAHAEQSVVVIDRDLLALPEIWAAAGTPFAVFPLTPDELVSLTNGEIGDIAVTPR